MSKLIKKAFFLFCLGLSFSYEFAYGAGDKENYCRDDFTPYYPPLDDHPHSPINSEPPGKTNGAEVFSLEKFKEALSSVAASRRPDITECVWRAVKGRSSEMEQRLMDSNRKRITDYVLGLARNSIFCANCYGAFVSVVVLDCLIKTRFLRTSGGVRSLLGKAMLSTGAAYLSGKWVLLYMCSTSEVPAFDIELKRTQRWLSNMVFDVPVWGIELEKTQRWLSNMASDEEREDDSWEAMRKSPIVERAVWGSELLGLPSHFHELSLEDRRNITRLLKELAEESERV